MEKDVAPLDIRRDCDKFFLEVISTLCFGRHKRPEPELVSSLMRVVIEGDDRSMLTDKPKPLKKRTRQSAKRIFLLRLLMEEK